MGRQERVDFYRNNRDYSSLLGDQEDEEEEEFEEDGGHGAGGSPEKEQEEDVSQECQEYFERRQRLKELERQRLRRSSDNGRSHTDSREKPLPYDNYGSFFGPSEPVVAKRIIKDALAIKHASNVAARAAKEVTEQHRVSKGTTVVSKSMLESKSVVSKKASNEVANLQRLKEARDYSFLFTDEDPSVPDDSHATKKAIKDTDRPKQTSASGKSGSATSQKALNSMKLSAPTPAKVGIKANIASTHKGQDRHVNPSSKLSKPPEKPPMSKTKVSSLPGSASNPSKTISGPGRPPPSRPVASTSGLLNGKKPLSSSSEAQLKSLVASAPKVAIKQSLASIAGKSAPGKAVLPKLVPTGSSEKKRVHFPESKRPLPTSRLDPKRTGTVTVARASAAGHVDQRRPAQSSKQVMRPPLKASENRKMQKRARESDSEDSFLDDDDGGGDVSSMIREMFGYNPNKYRDLDDEDDRFMETNFRSIQMEEKRSARIAREEDERELALIEEEERRERELARKKRKQQR